MPMTQEKSKTCITCKGKKRIKAMVQYGYVDIACPDCKEKKEERKDGRLQEDK